MSKMMLYVDGSTIMEATPPTGRVYHMGWGLVAQYADQHHEVQGCTTVNKNLDGFHELAAFTEGVLFAHARGIAPQDLAVYTDDQAVGYANFTLHPENYRGGHAQGLRERVSQLCQTLYSSATESLVLEYLQHARIQWVKGHRFLVYQCRADYLARHAARGAKSTAQPGRLGPLGFEDWLSQGFQYYTSGSEEPSTWYPPFVEQAPLHAH